MVFAKEHLAAASRELFRRAPDERLSSLEELLRHCQKRRQEARELWAPPRELMLETMTGALRLQTTGGQSEVSLGMSDWSFSQLCRTAGVDKATVNRLSPDTAARVFEETMPRHINKPMQLFAERDTLRSLHCSSYARLFDADVVELAQEFGDRFRPPQAGMNGATGLYCGEQDMFLFLIDPTGWTEIEGEQFAPGFFLWNSEVGKRSLGIHTFWFQAVCQNHIVWDAVEVLDYTRKHTSSIYDSLDDIRRMIDALVRRRDERQDRFVECIRRAMQTKLSEDLDETTKELMKQGLPKSLVSEALAIAQQHGRFTIFSIVDAFTRMAGQLSFAGDRRDADAKAAGLLSLALAA